MVVVTLIPKRLRDQQQHGWAHAFAPRPNDVITNCSDQNYV
jgi:hypothetical protein